MSDFFRPESEHTYLGWLRRARPDLYAQLRKPALDVLNHVLEHADWSTGTRCWASIRHLAAGANNDGKGHHKKTTKDQLDLLCKLGILKAEPQKIRSSRGQLVTSYSVMRPTKGARKAPTFSDSRALLTPEVGAFDPHDLKGRTCSPEHGLPLKSHESRGGGKRPLSDCSDSSAISDWYAGDVAEWHAAGRVVTGQVFERPDGQLALRVPGTGFTPTIRTIAPCLKHPPATLQEQRR